MSEWRKSGPSRRSLAAAALLLALSSSVAFGQTTIDFEEFPAPLSLSTQYGPQGVIFPGGAFLDADPGARSGTQVLRSGNPGTEFDTGPLAVRFSSPQRRVAFFAAAPSPNIEGTLRAFDEGGMEVDRDGPKLVSVGSFTTLFEVALSDAVITRIELQMESTVFEAIDDLEFEGEAVGELPTEPPTVAISFPSEGDNLDGSSATVTGSVTGSGLFDRARLTLAYGLPADSTAPPISSSLPLSGTGSSRSFTQEWFISPGPNQVTVEAENIAGLKSSDSVSFINLPEVVLERFDAEGGAASFGQLVYGAVAAGCRFAVYELGAIFAEGGGTTIVTGDIFDKWLAERDQGAALGRLGCPVEEERGAPGGARAQSFARGRIYAGLPTGAHFVPAVFVEAIDTLGGEAATGVPLADPTHSIGAFETHLFQRFTRPNRPFLLPSTLEIRGWNPPVLHVQRQGGNLGDGFFFRDNAGNPTSVRISDRAPSLSQRFPCDGPLGPCRVDPPSSPDLLQPIERADPGLIFCNDTTFPGDTELRFTAEWVPIIGDYVQTPLLGIVSDFHPAAEDFPLSHECHGGFHVDGRLFSSDWNLSVRPLHPHRGLLVDTAPATLEVEWERCWSNYFFAFPVRTEPVEGDLVFISGRWIIDCGHDDPYQAEIHPPSVLVSMRTVEHRGRPATQASIWVNGVYSGEPVEFEIFPPPRPSPTAILSLEKPTDETAAIDVDLEYTYPSRNTVGLRFTASRREVTVGRLTGEMKWQPGRVYYGVWLVWWAE